LSFAAPTYLSDDALFYAGSFDFPFDLNELAIVLDFLHAREPNHCWTGVPPVAKRPTESAQAWKKSKSDLVELPHAGKVYPSSEGLRVEWFRYPGANFRAPYQVAQRTGDDFYAPVPRVSSRVRTSTMTSNWPAGSGERPPPCSFKFPVAGRVFRYTDRTREESSRCNALRGDYGLVCKRARFWMECLSH